MKNRTHINNSGIGLLAALGVAALVATPFYVKAQTNRPTPPVPGRIQTLSPFFLLKGQVTAVAGSQVIVKTADYGPGLSHAAGVHSKAIVSGKTYLGDISHAMFQATDGTGTANQQLAVGDNVVMLVTAVPGPAQQVGNTTMFLFTVNEIIRNDQTPQ